MRVRRFSAFIILAFIFAEGGCSFVKKDMTLASVDGHRITKKELFLKAELYGLDIRTKKEAEKLLNLLVNDYLILFAAKRDGVNFSKKELDAELQKFVPGYSPRSIKDTLKKGRIKYSRWLKDIKEKIIRKKEMDFVMKKKIKLSEDEVKDYYWSNIIYFKRAHKVRARQIVVKEKETAKELLNRIKAGASFAGLAGKYSVMAEASKGGDLGYFGKKDMPSFIVAAVFKLKKGSVSGIIKSSYGYHIFKCVDIKYAETPKFKDVKKEVYDRCFEKKKDELFGAWMKGLRKNADIKINRRNLDKFIKEVGQ